MHSGPAPFGGHNGRHRLRKALHHTAGYTATLGAGDRLRSGEVQRAAARRLQQCAARAAKNEVAQSVSSTAATEAAADVAGAAAADASATAASATATSNWFHALSHRAGSVRRRIQAAMGDPKAWQAPKFEMPGMRMDVDFINPAITTLRNFSHDLWAAVPAPAQQASPYVGTASATFIVTRWTYAARLRSQEEASKKLQGELTALLEKYNTLKAHGQQSLLDSARAEREAQMAQAVAQATTAAAAAASAASSAVEAATLLLNNKVKVLRA